MVQLSLLIVQRAKKMTKKLPQWIVYKVVRTELQQDYLHNVVSLAKTMHSLQESVLFPNTHIAKMLGTVQKYCCKSDYLTDLNK